MEDIVAEVADLSKHAHKHGLKDGRVVGEPCDEAGQVAPDDPNDCAAARHNDEARQTFSDVGNGYVVLLYLCLLYTSPSPRDS